MAKRNAVKLYRTSGSAVTPTAANLYDGELAVCTAETSPKIFLKTDNNNIATFVDKAYIDSADTQIEKITLTALNDLNKRIITISGDVSEKQDALVSGTNIKTINNQSLLGSGNITITAQSITIDTAITSTGTNAVQGKAIYTALQGKLGTGATAYAATRDAKGNTIDATYATKTNLNALSASTTAFSASVVNALAAKQDKLTIDTALTTTSTNPVTSKGIADGGSVIIAQLSESSATPTDTDYLVVKDSSKSTLRKVSLLWDYVASKLKSVMGIDKAAFDAKANKTDLNSYATTTALNNGLAQKVNNTTYTAYTADTKTALGNKLDTTAFTQYSAATKATIDKKANSATTLAGYGITGTSINKTTSAITIEGVTITPLTTHQSLADYAKTTALTAYTTTAKTEEINKSLTALTDSYNNFTSATNTALSSKVENEAFTAYTATTQNALAGKLDTTAFTQYSAATKDEIATKVATKTYDSFTSTTNTALGQKASSADLNALSSATIAFSSATKTALDGKANTATTLAGYGITDAKIADGTITLGSTTITPLTQHQSLGNYATTATTQTITNNLKALSGVVETFSGNVKTKIEEVEKKITSVYRVKGSKTDYSDLPTTGNEEGDVWNVVNAYGSYPAGTNWVWVAKTSTEAAHWDALGGAVDLSGYYTKTDIDSKLGTKVDNTTYTAYTSTTKTSLDTNTKNINNLSSATIAFSSATQTALKSKMDTTGASINNTTSAITINGVTITPLTTHQSLAAYAKSNDLNSLSTATQTLETKHASDVSTLTETIAKKQDKVTFNTINGTALTSTTSTANNITFDSASSTTSTNAIQNKVVTSLLSGKQDKLTIDSTSSLTSTNVVQNKAISMAITALSSSVVTELNKKQEKVVFNTLNGSALTSTTTAQALKINVPSVDSTTSTTSTNAVSNKAITTMVTAFSSSVVTELGKKLNVADIDTALDTGSTNPVQNKAVASAISAINITIEENELVVASSFNELNDKLTGLSAYTMEQEENSPFYELTWDGVDGSIAWGEDEYLKLAEAYNNGKVIMWENLVFTPQTGQSLTSDYYLLTAVRWNNGTPQYYVISAGTSTISGAWRTANPDSSLNYLKNTFSAITNRPSWAQMNGRLVVYSGSSNTNAAYRAGLNGQYSSTGLWSNIHGKLVAWAGASSTGDSSIAAAALKVYENGELIAGSAQITASTLSAMNASAQTLLASGITANTIRMPFSTGGTIGTGNTYYRSNWSGSSTANTLTLNSTTASSGERKVVAGSYKISASTIYENGFSAKSITINNEIVELMGVGTSISFNGWVVLSRKPFNKAGQGKELRPLAIGYVYSSGSSATITGKTFDGTNLVVNRVSEGIYLISATTQTQWFSNQKSNIMTMVTCDTSSGAHTTDMATGAIIEKSISGKTFSIKIYRKNAGDKVDGSFYFMIYDLSQW